MESEVISNVNLNNVASFGNTGAVSNFKEPGIKTAMVLVPKGTIIPAAEMVSQTAFNTYITSMFQNNNTGLRWRAFVDLDDFKDLTKKPTSEDTGLNQFDIAKFNPKYSFRYMTGMGNFIEALTFHNTQFHDIFWIDSNGTWQGTQDPTGAGGLRALSLAQLFILDAVPTDVKGANQYMFTVQLASRLQVNDNYACYVAGTDPLGIQMLQDVVLSDISSIVGTALSITATTTVVLAGKYGVGSSDFMAAYTGSLTAACFTAYNLSTGAAATIASATFGQINVGSQNYWYAKIVLSAAPTAGNQVQYALAAPSVTNPIIEANVVTEIPNMVIHQF